MLIQADNARYIAECQKVLEKSGLVYKVTIFVMRLSYLIVLPALMRCTKHPPVMSGQLQ